MKSEHLMHGASVGHAPGRKMVVARASGFPRVWPFAFEYPPRPAGRRGHRIGVGEPRA